MSERARITRVSVCGWGGGERVPVSRLSPTDEAAMSAAVRRIPAAGGISRGLGRSYGDAAQLRGGLVIDATKLDGYSFDAERGVLSAHAGARLGDLLRALVPQGWILPVLPGTQHVTVGGMIASDVHGKDHVQAGSIGAHVSSLRIIDPVGEIRRLAPGDPGFAATVGGMGLTGPIVSAEIRLQRIASSWMHVDTDRAESLDEVFTALRAPGGPHRVAWLDPLGRCVRGVVTRAEYATPDIAGSARAGDALEASARITVPAWWPGGLPRLGARAFNELRFRLAPRHERGRLEPIGRHMFPLDRLGAWPRLYGPLGLVQYQCVAPTGDERVIEAVLATLAHHKVPCFLAVLKDFGDGLDAPLSFPMRGWTLALDLPRAAQDLDAALTRCDEIVASAGGRVYLTKDSRLGADALRAMYPRLGEWRRQRDAMDPDGRWRSDLGLRVGLVEQGVTGAPARAPGRRTGPSRGVLVVGGSSEIGLAIVARLSADGPVRPWMLGRNEATMRDGLTQKGLTGMCAPLDLDDHDAIAPAVARAFEELGTVDVVVLAAGVLGGQAGLDADPAEAAEVLRVNLAGCGSALIEALRGLHAQGRGSLVVLSSVAAERPRAGNPVYGAAKAGLDALAQGLSDAVAGSRVEVIVVRPGFVHTKMTAGLPPAPLATTAAAVAEATVSALGGGSRTVWVPWTLRPLFAGLRHLPRGVYRRLPL